MHVQITLSVLVFGLISLVAINVAVLFFVGRSHHRISQFERLTRQIRDVALLSEAEQRRVRFALRNLAAALRMEEAVELLDYPPDSAILLLRPFGSDRLLAEIDSRSRRVRADTQQ